MAVQIIYHQQAAMEMLPAYIGIAFILTTFLTVFLFWKAAHYHRVTIVVILAWLFVQAIVSLQHFYTITDTRPPRFLLLAAPPVVLIILLLLSGPGRRYLDNLNASTLTILHIIRIAVELVLWALFVHKAVPQLMTFEGRNFDIVAGLSAPLIWYLAYRLKKLSKTALLWWNIACIVLLLNIVINAVLSAPGPLQQFAFDQPNRAILYFPFVWLPCCVVPLVLLSHLAVIRQLVKKH